MPKDNGISVKRMLRARRDVVFDAWTQPDMMAKWFFPGDGWTATVKADLKVGGRWEAVMQDTKNVTHLQFGEYRELVRASRLVFTWNCPDLGVVDSVVTIELSDEGDRTGLTLTHELPPDPKIRRGHEEGWHGCLGNLEKQLDSRN